MEAHRTQAKVAQVHQVQVAMEVVVVHQLQVVVAAAALEFRGTYHYSSLEEALTLDC